MSASSRDTERTKETVVGRQALVDYAASLLRATGVGPEDAATVASDLVDADCRGVASHGVARLPVYLDRIAAGGTSPSARPVIERETGATAVVDGRNALGLVVGRYGMEQAVRLARRHGVAAVSCRASGHFGAAAQFARMAPGCDCVGIAMTNVNVAMAPWGGITPLLGNNPLAIAAPTSGSPFVLDMALSTVARGRIRLASARGEEIPAGWALDAMGNPTTDPTVALAGLITPLAGPKGSALAIAVDILCALLSGAASSPDVQPQSALDVPQDVGHFFVAMHIPAFVELRTFTTRIDQMLDRIRNSSPAQGVKEIFAPGDLERRAEERTEREGLRLQDSTWRALLAKGAELGVPAPEPEQRSSSSTSGTL